MQAKRESIPLPKSNIITCRQRGPGELGTQVYERGPSPRDMTVEDKRRTILFGITARGQAALREVRVPPPPATRSLSLIDRLRLSLIHRCYFSLIHRFCLSLIDRFRLSVIYGF
jgi:hypothetical protein